MKYNNDTKQKQDEYNILTVKQYKENKAQQPYVYLLRRENRKDATMNMTISISLTKVV